MLLGHISCLVWMLGSAIRRLPGSRSVVLVSGARGDLFPVSNEPGAASEVWYEPVAGSRNADDQSVGRVFWNR